MSEGPSFTRTAVVQRGRKLEYFTIAWNTIEGLVGSRLASSRVVVSLVGFGIDSFIK
jgi:hypothetical protein